MPSTLLTAVEVAAFLRVGRWRVYELVRRGLLKAVHVGRTVRFDPDAVRAFIDAGGRCEPPQQA